VGPQAWGLAGDHAPQLLLAIAIVVPVVRHPKVAPAGAVPVAEERRECAITGRERDRRRISTSRRRGTNELVVVAVVGPLDDGVHREVVSERHGGEGRGPLPLRAECRRPGGAAVVTPPFVRALEAAVTGAAQEDVLTDAQDRQVCDGIPIDVERIGARDVGEIGCGVMERREAELCTLRALIAEESGRLRAAGEVDVLASVAVAVEDGHAAAHEEHELTVVAVVDPGGGRLLDETRRRQGDCRSRLREPPKAECEADDDERQADGGRRDPSAPSTGHGRH